MIARIESGGIAALTRQALHRDRVLATFWIAVLIVMVYASAAATAGIYGSLEARIHAAEAIGTSPATVALYGPILDPRSLGELSMAKMTVMYAVFVALLFVSLVRRHTRVDEERGLTELVGSAPIERNVPYVAALVESSILLAVLAVGAAAASMAGGLPVGGSVLFSLSWLGTGLVATAVTAVAVQISPSARTCGTIAIGTLIALYAVRAVGDVSWHWLSWLSPFGWNTQLRAWSEPRLWVLGLYVVLTAALLMVAGLLRQRRDLGSGLFRDSTGPAVGAVHFASPIALTWRLHRTAVVVWTISAGVMGVLLGAIAPVAQELLDSAGIEEMFRRLGGPGAIQDALLAAELSVAAIATSCFGIAVAAHATEDERTGHNELLGATPTPRSRSWFGTSAVAFGGTAWLMLVTGFAAGVGSGAGIGRLTVAALVHIPAIWVVTGIALAGYGFGGRWAAAGWAALGAFLVSGVVGDLLELPSWITGLSPFQHVPLLPSAEFAWRPEAALMLAAGCLLALGWARFRGRDIA